MRKLELSTIGIVVLWIIVLLLLATMPTKAQDIIPSSTITACYTRTDAGAVFTFSNIPDTWLGETGWYFIGDAATLSEHTLTVTGLQFDGGYSYAIVGAGDYSDNDTASTEISNPCDSISNAENGLVGPNYPIPISTPAPVSTGRTCVVQYPKIILVCS